MKARIWTVEKIGRTVFATPGRPRLSTQHAGQRYVMATTKEQAIARSGLK